MIIKFEPNRRVLNYLALFMLIFFNGLLFGVLAYIGRNVINNTKKSQVLEVSQDVRNEMSGQKR
jgi:hypothetical protein